MLYQEPRDLRTIHTISNVLYTSVFAIAQLIVVIIIAAAIAHVAR